jgi:hypothetical protein
MMSAWAVVLISLMALDWSERPDRALSAKSITEKMQQRVDTVEGVSAVYPCQSAGYCYPS